MAKSSGFKFKLNSVGKILKDHGLDENGKAVEYLRDECKRLMAPFVPGGAGGELSKNTSTPNSHSIKYIEPEAHYQFTGKLMLAKNGSSWAKRGEKKHYTGKKLKYHTSGTGDHWDKRMLQKRKDDLVKDLENYIKTGG